MLLNVQDFPKHVLELVGCSNLHSAFPQAHWARKSTWFRAIISSSSQEGFQRILGLSKNRTTTLKSLVRALEARYQAQN